VFFFRSRHVSFRLLTLAAPIISSELWQFSEVPLNDAPPVFLVQLIDVLPYYLNELLFGTVLEIFVLAVHKPARLQDRYGPELHSLRCCRLHWHIRHVVGRHPVADIEDVAAY
jgi:hypothetical protein